MLEYLVKLMEDGDFQRCLRLAEQQLLRGGMTRNQLAKLNMVISRCRLGMNDLYGAIPSGQLAVKLARDLEEWDLLGRALLNLGTALVGTRQYDQALLQFYTYLEHLPHYSASRRLEGAAWKNIGIAHQRKLETDRAIDALNRARQWFAKQEIDHSTFTCTHDLVNTYLQKYEAGPDPSLLTKVEELLRYEKEIVRRQAADTYFRSLYLYDQAAYYMHCGRLGRAMVCAMKAMEVRKGDFGLAFHSNMVLHRCTRSLGDAKQALGYAIAARVQALQGRHFELEFLATQAMAEVIREQGTRVVRELDDEYMALGIDLGQYLSPSLLKREN